MEDDSTLYVGLDVHKDSITVAYSLGVGEVELLGKIGTAKTDIDRLCKRLQSKARRIRIVYEAGPCGYGLYRQLGQKGFDCMVCAPQGLSTLARCALYRPSRLGAGASALAEHVCVRQRMAATGVRGTSAHDRGPPCAMRSAGGRVARGGR